MFFERVLRLLNTEKVKYLVIGGVAVNLHGFQRATGDLDIMISLETSNVRRFVTMVKRLSWKPRVPVDVEAFADSTQRKIWIEEKGMKVFSVYNPKSEFEHVDVMVENYLDFKKAYRNRKIVSAGDIKVPVISIPDLVRLKEIAGRQRDKIDIQTLLQIERLQNAKKKSRS